MIKNNRVTLRDIAEKTGYTINTVSRALNHKNDISQKTIEYINSVADEMGYINDNIASSMRTGRTGTIAVILADITNPLFAIMVRETEQLSSEYNYSVFILNTNEDKNLELQAIKNALGKKVDGFIICPCPDCHDNLEFLKKTGKPYILVGRRVKGHPSVILDDIKSGYLAVKYLTDHYNCRRILFINGLLSISCAEDRLAGYRTALEEAGIEYRPELVLTAPTKAGTIGKIIHELSENKTEYDSIFAFSDLLAYEAINTLTEMGKRVPADIPIVGIDHLHGNLFYMPPLDSVGAADKRMSEEAVKILMNTIKDGKPSCLGQICLDVKLFPAS